MSTTPHKDAEKLMAIAQGKQMQCYRCHGTPWADVDGDAALVALTEGQPCRIKPEFIVINGVECPKPELGETAQYAVTVAIPLLFQDHTVHFSTAVGALSVYQALIKPFKECQE